MDEQGLMRKLAMGLGILPLAISACFWARVHTAEAPTDTGLPAPQFELESHLGGTVSLSSLHADGPAVLVFYRGFW